MKGSISGGDWSFPADFNQLKIFLNSLVYSWAHTGSIFGSRQLSPTSAIFLGPVYLFARLGISVPLVIKIFLLLIFALAGSNMNLYLRYLGVKPIAAFITGIIFILTPIFFNYALMGWIFVLLSLALLPLFIYLFLRAIDEENYSYALLSALIFSVAILQSQTLIWYPLSLLSVVVGYCREPKQFWVGLKYFFLVLGVFFVLNLYWLPSLLLLPDKGVTGGELVLGADSIGTSYRLVSSNILKLWGSLYNFQFESSFPKIFWPVSYIIPVLAFSALFFWRRYRRHLSYLIFIFLVLVLVYSLDRSFIAKLPFSNLIRDVSRFIVLSAFALITMVGIALDGLFSWKSKKWLAVLVILILFVNTLPFWTGKLFSGRVIDSDFRFRTKDWPVEYDDLNNKLSNDKMIQRALFLPIGGRVSLTDDQKFNGPFNELTDIYPSFAPVSGLLGISSRGQSAVSELIYQIDQSIGDQNIQQLDFLAETSGINLLVMRRDIQFYDWNQAKTANFELQLRELVKQEKAEVYFDQGSIFAIKLKSSDELVSASSGPAEIKANFGKILSNFFRSNVISKNDFPQIADLPELKNLFGDKVALTFDDQNLSYSKYSSNNPKIYQFFSLENLSEIVPMTKMWLEGRNLDTLLDPGLRANNNQAISQLEKLEKANLIGDYQGKYIVFADNEIENSTIYFQINPSSTCSSIKINDKDFNIDCQPDGTGILKHIDLLKGINIFQTENNLTPLFVLTSSLVVPTTIPDISFKSLSPVKYQISVKEIKDDFVLNFDEGYNEYWQLTNSNGFFASKIVADNDHFVSNGYANGFKIKLMDLEKTGLLKKESDGSYSAEFYLEFLPQRYVVIGSIAATIGFFVIFTLIILKRKNEQTI